MPRRSRASSLSSVFRSRGRCIRSTYRRSKVRPYFSAICLAGSVVSARASKASRNVSFACLVLARLP
eukprot:388786-Karenia_brevis.AAC.1